MSVSNLLEANSYDLFCNSITTAGSHSQDPVVIGENATAAGGTGCVSIGLSSRADGSKAIAIGENSAPTVLDTIAVGHGAGADQVGSIAIGARSFSQATGSVAIGQDTITALGPGAAGVAIGNGAKAGLGSVALGQGADALINGSIAVGLNAGTGTEVAGGGEIFLAGIPNPVNTTGALSHSMPVKINNTTYYLQLSTTPS